MRHKGKVQCCISQQRVAYLKTASKGHAGKVPRGLCDSPRVVPCRGETLQIVQTGTGLEVGRGSDGPLDICSVYLIFLKCFEAFHDLWQGCITWGSVVL